MWELMEKEKEENKKEQEKVQFEEKVQKITNERVDVLLSGLTLEMTHLKEEISQIKGGGMAEKVNNIGSAVEQNEAKMFKLEGKCELLTEMMEKNTHAQLQQMKIQLEAKEEEKICVEKQLNEEKAKLEEEICALRVKLEDMEKKLEGAKAKKITQTLAHKQMTSFDLVNGIKNLEPHNNCSESQQSAGGELFKWRGYPIVARLGSCREKIIFSLHLQYQNPQKFRANFKLLPSVHYLLRFRKPTYIEKPSPICRNAFHLFGTSSELNYNCEPLIIETISTDNLHEWFIEVYVEPYSMAQMVHSYDGILTWTIDNFYNRRQMEREGLIEWQESPYFYTGPSGYRVQLHAYLDGAGKYKKSGLTVQVSFLSGEFDAELSGSFPHRTTVTLTNGNDPEYNVTKTVEKNIVEEKSYALDLCDVKETLFALENDAFVINVAIKAL